MFSLLCFTNAKVESDGSAVTLLLTAYDRILRFIPACQNFHVDDQKYGSYRNVIVFEEGVSGGIAKKATEDLPDT